ncbi:MAG: hypothetical protein II956_10000 [Bacteroidales bacterium]|nr:hypothetical protein [Bacteroidales bacterium]
MIQKIITITAVLFCALTVSAQRDDEYSYLFFENDDSSKAVFKAHADCFFKNNEYFGDFAKGYTLIGYMLQPEFIYRPVDKVEISVLWNVLKYSGKDDFSDYKPYFRIKFSPTKKVSLILGRLDGTLSHRLIEPIYKPERYYLNNIENGLQCHYKTDSYRGELWLNWEKFLLWNDPWQELLTVGHKSELKILEKGLTSFFLTGEALISHRGGQIDLSDDKVKTLENGALGFQLKRPKLTFDFRFVQYHAIDPTYEVPYLDGYAFYNKLFLKFKNFGFVCGHWQGNCFMNFKGEELFSSEAIEPENNKNIRSVLFNELFYSQQFYKTFSIKVGANSYFNILNGDFEYTYMLSFVYNQNFPIRKNK